MSNFQEIFNNLTNILENECVLEDVSREFSSLKSDFERFKFSLALLENANLLPVIKSIDGKNSLSSEKYRNEGNRLFVKNKNIDALECYSCSVAWAPLDSKEICLAFANRSAVSFSLKRYGDCIVDIDRALNSTYPEHLLYKLYERKAKCYLILNDNILAKQCFEQALNFISKSECPEGKIIAFKNSINKVLENIRSNFECNNNISPKNVDKKYCSKLPILSFPRNKEILSACRAIQIEYNAEMGKHLVARQVINPGDVLAIERPYSSILLPNSYNLYCFNCLKRCHTLIPCHHCTKVLYCSSKCRDVNYKSSHKMECHILPHLIEMGCCKIILLAVRTLFIASECDRLKQLKDYIKLIEDRSKSSGEQLKGFDESFQYNSEDYCTVHYLATNTQLRTTADLFKRSCFANFIIHFIDKLTNFFAVNSKDINGDDSLLSKSNDFGEYFDDKCFAGGLILKYLQIMPCNAHEVSEMCVEKITKDYIIDNNNSVGDNFNDRLIKYDSKEICGALYPVLSLINHSCDPNVVRHSYDGDIVVLTAIRKISLDEQLFDNYGYHHAVHDLQTRQEHLKSQYHFTCKCRACSENWPLFHSLPDDQAIYKKLELRNQVEKSSKIFPKLIEKVLKHNIEDSDALLKELIDYLCLLENAIERPWKEYSACQEAVKQLLSLRGNHYINI